MPKRKQKQKLPVEPKITFVGGKWYNELGKEVPRPPRKDAAPAFVPQQQESLQRYDEDTIYEKLATCSCARPQFTGHVPGCVHFADALYVCERGNRETVAQLAKLGETTISDLERRRLDFTETTPECPDRIPQDDGRRRCWRCPYWNRHLDETPFDHQKQGE
jgi:hypothetical protein